MLVGGPGVDMMENNVFESALELAGTGTAASAQLEEWGQGGLYLSFYQIPKSVLACLG